MRKIEEAAQIFCGGAQRDQEKFTAGARYVLDAMTSDAAVKAFDRVRILRTSTLEQLVAVRKEIEGE